MVFTGQLPTAAIYGVSGLELTSEEQQFFAENPPFGFILFARNISTPEQVRQLVDSVREASGNPELLVFVDQEGGRVARLKPPHWPLFPPSEVFANMYAKGQYAQANELIALNYRLIAHHLLDVGITVDCAPMLDVRFEGSHDIVGDRAFGYQPEQVIELAKSALDGLHQGGVLGVIKHIPGHGRAHADSHESLPQVSASVAELEIDFAPFKAFSDAEMAMTAHICYDALDATECATLSKTVIDIIRGDIGFDGLLMTDDLSMKALQGSFEMRVEKAFLAGCDMMLHCNGDMQEMQAVAAATAPLGGIGLQRAERVIALKNALLPQPLDVADVTDKIQALIS